MGHLSAYITSHLTGADISPAEFGRRVGVAKSSAWHILDGSSVPSERTLKKIAEAFPALPLARLRAEALKDTPFELPEGAELLDLDERNLVKATIRQLLKSSGKADLVQSEDPPRDEAPNVIEMPRPQYVKKAAYNPGEE